MKRTQTVSCRCGAVCLTLTGPNIMSSECMCDSCRTASDIFASLPDGVGTKDDKGATHMIIHRTDRVACDKGAENLKAHKLTPKTPTRRVVATCCNTPMFLDFKPGHWLSFYAINWSKGDLPALEYRIFCNNMPDPSILPDDVPNGKPVTFGVIWRLASAAVRMGFRRPKVTFVEGWLDSSAK
ncbi:GFA family protein [Falsihalocynthiibacter sp. SS001]|uniref:GFA family protein n=1 Tax=Falsihalocynthiibacter sp. SS001 TaxID=3349698 RepID=UPI0036D317CA